jgi:ribosomal protein S27AE
LLLSFLAASGMLGRMQKVMRVKLTIEAYVREQFQTRMRPPEQCPNCGRFHGLWAHGYYDRDSTESTGKPLRFLVRRFRCGHCGITVSCLPCFAQPYRLVNHTTLEAFLKGRSTRRDVQARQGLLQRYVRCFAEWRPCLVRIVGHRFGRASPKENATAFWRRAVAACGSTAELTIQLVSEFRTTCFRTYRCHQPSIVQ